MPAVLRVVRAVERLPAEALPRGVRAGVVVLPLAAPVVPAAAAWPVAVESRAAPARPPAELARPGATMRAQVAPLVHRVRGVRASAGLVTERLGRLVHATGSVLVLRGPAVRVRRVRIATIPRSASPHDLPAAAGSVVVPTTPVPPGLVRVLEAVLRAATMIALVVIARGRIVRLATTVLFVMIALVVIARGRIVRLATTVLFVTIALVVIGRGRIVRLATTVLFATVGGPVVGVVLLVVTREPSTANVPIGVAPPAATVYRRAVSPRR